METEGFNPRSSGAANDFVNTSNKWQDYLDRHEAGNVLIDIVNIALNTLVSVDQDLEQQYPSNSAESFQH